MDINEWLAYGYENKFVTKPACATHHGIPTSEAEDDLWELGEDPCEHVLRLANSPAEWDNIERNSQKNYG